MDQVAAGVGAVFLPWWVAGVHNGCYFGVMNTDQLARTTFVLDRVTSERLTAIAARMGVSQSALVRDVLQEPVELMHRWVLSLPRTPRLRMGSALCGQWRPI